MSVDLVRAEQLATSLLDPYGRQERLRPASTIRALVEQVRALTEAGNALAKELADWQPTACAEWHTDTWPDCDHEGHADDVAALAAWEAAVAQ